MPEAAEEDARGGGRGVEEEAKSLWVGIDASVGGESERGEGTRGREEEAKSLSIEDGCQRWRRRRR